MTAGLWTETNTVYPLPAPLKPVHSVNYLHQMNGLGMFSLHELKSLVIMSLTWGTFSSPYTATCQCIQDNSCKYHG